VAGEIADLGWVLLVLGAAGLVVFAAVLGAALFRRRDPAGTERSGIRWIVIGGVVMPVVVLVVVFGFTVQSMRAIPNAAPRDALTVEIVGHQWWWEVRYPYHQVVTANEMHIPVGRPVELRLTSADVIHSFWVPQLGGKLDLLPDRSNTLVLEADGPGEYRGQCAEFCGLQHAKMRFLAVAEEPERFASWLADQQQSAAAPADATTGEGRSVFLESGCASCHTIRGTSAAATKGPDLTHFASRRTIAAGTLPNTRSHLSDWIADPAAVKRGTQMQAIDLDDGEMAVLLDYLESLG
jgi:cytochrome c oxidase subunit 2